MLVGILLGCFCGASKFFLPRGSRWVRVGGVTVLICASSSLGSCWGADMFFWGKIFFFNWFDGRSGFGGNLGVGGVSKGENLCL